jgi:putative phosphoribosyl transferase
VTDPHRMERVRIPTSAGDLVGDLELPDHPVGIVLFAHGSGSGRLSPRNRWVASRLREAGLATLLFDLLTPAEEAIDVRTSELRFDIPLLATRLGEATAFLTSDSRISTLPVGYFGASTGAAAALIAAARHPATAAVVSRGGRPDLAADALERVEAPTLLIVGGDDAPIVLDLNERAFARLERAEKRLEIVPGAGHLFEEPGALEQVAELAEAWFLEYLPAAASGLPDPLARRSG